jgi:hypothetical protein
VRKLLVLFVAVLVIAANVNGATVVLKGGKVLQVERFALDGGYLIVHLHGGRQVSYPVSSVDMEATRAAAGPVAPPPQPTPDTGPASPFSKAMAKEGERGLVVTDSDVAHIQGGEQVEPGKEGKPGQPRARLVVVNYQQTQVSETEWQIAAVVANQGDAPADGISVAMKATDSEGNTVGNATAMVAGRLDAGAQGQATGKMTPTGTIVQVTFELGWQPVIPAPQPAADAPPVVIAPVAKPPATPKPVSPMAPVNPMDGRSATTQQQPNPPGK